MARNILIAFRVSSEEKMMLEFIAARSQRSLSDAIRQVVLDAALNLFSKEPSPFEEGKNLMNYELAAGRDQN